MASVSKPQDIVPVESLAEEKTSVFLAEDTLQQSIKSESGNWLSRTRSDPTGASSERLRTGLIDRSTSISSGTIPATLRSRSEPKASRNLQLPSFDSLGIAVPHPDRPRTRGGQLTKDAYSRTMLAMNNLYTPAPDGLGSGYSQPSNANHNNNNFGTEQYLHTQIGCSLLLTPPDEARVVSWGLPSRSINGTAASSPFTESDNESRHRKPLLASTAASDSGMSSSGPESSSLEASNATERNMDSGRMNLRNSDMLRDDNANEGRLHSAVEALVSESIPNTTVTEAVRILSYTLPCPPCFGLDNSASTVIRAAMPHVPHHRESAENEESSPATSTAINLIANAIQEKFNQRGKRAYIHINYAVLPSFDLGNLPTTPTVTSPGHSQGVALSPGYFGGGGIELDTAFRPAGANSGSPGYFASSLFSSVVLVNQQAPKTYQGPKSLDADVGQMKLSPLQRKAALPSPNPILPPSSQHISLLERYIPPASPSDDRNIFSPTSSLLFDRLFELSPAGGSLLFIYPTKRGAYDFCRHYLGPVIEPLLRRLMVLHQLPPHLLSSIQRMTAVSDMMEFDDLKETIQNLCASMNADDKDEGPTGEMSSDDEESRSRAAPGKVGVQLVYSARKRIRLDPRVWPEWWAQQESHRIRQLVRRHFTSVPPPPPTNPITLNLPSTFPSSAPASVAPPQSRSTVLSDDEEEEEDVACDRPRVTSPSQLLSYTSASPGDLSREVLEGVRASGSPIPNRGFGEVVADGLLRNSGPGGSGISMGTTGLSHGRMLNAEVAMHVREGVEVGVFVLRRGR